MAGMKLKATSGWVQGGRYGECGADCNGTDEFGFSALPSGEGGGGGVGYSANWWSATEYDYSAVYTRSMGSHGTGAGELNIFNPDDRLSVRCLQGQGAPPVYSLTVYATPGDGGTVSPTSQQNIAVGTTVEISAAPASGYTFLYWTSSKGSAIFADTSSANTTVTVNSSISVTAHFQEVVDTVYIVDDRDGKAYRTVTIGTQTWMAENLNYETEMTSTDSSWCYGNNTANCAIYGRLYNWETANEVCPSGWHLPTREEWNTLVVNAGGSSVAGKALKSTTGWASNGNGTDDFDFSALPGGGRYYSYVGSFNTAGDNGFWWSATEYAAAGYAYYRLMLYDNDYVREDTFVKSDGFSVRCVQD
jgi:uncharacterized protein (TIGR02145 family)